MAAGGVYFVDQLSMFIHGLRAVGREAFNREGPRNADAFFILIRFVIEEFVISLGGDGGVDFALPRDAGFPEILQRCRGGVGPWQARIVGQVVMGELGAADVVQFDQGAFGGGGGCAVF